MTDSIDTRLGRIEEAINRFKEDRRESRDEARAATDALLGRLDRMDQTVNSTANAVASLGLGKIIDRVSAAEGAIKSLQERTKNLPLIDREVMFWRRLLGGGFQAAWKVGAVMLGSGGVGALITKWIGP